MKEESIKAYSRRVSQANRSELIVIMYDIILEDIGDAEKLLEQGDADGFRKSLAHAVRFVTELMVALDMRYPVSKELMRLYIYVNGCLNHARIQRRADELEQAQKVLRGLYTAFEKVAGQDASLPVMEHTQKLYAGLTYGRGVLNETLVSPDEATRGFRA